MAIGGFASNVLQMGQVATVLDTVVAERGAPAVQAAINTVAPATPALVAAAVDEALFRPTETTARQAAADNAAKQAERESRFMKALAVGAAFIPVIGKPVAGFLNYSAQREVAGTQERIATADAALQASLVNQGGSTMIEGQGFDWGSLLNTALQYRMQRDQQRTQLQIAQAGQVLPDFGAVPGGGNIGMTQAAFPAIPAFLGGAARVGGALVRRGGALITAAGKAISSRKAVQLAKVLGIQGAATALGIGAVELAEAVLSEQQRTRRGKGVSAAALKTTRRTMRTVERMHRQIAGYCRDAGVRTTRVVRVAAPGKRCR